MILQLLARRKQYILTLLTVILSIFYSLPVFAHSPWSFRSDYNSATTTAIMIADRSDSITKPNQAISLFQRLDLTKEQQQQIKQIHHQYRQQVQQKKEQIARLQQQLSDMMVGTESVALLRAKNQQLNILRQEMETLRFETMLATREILTLRQRQKFKKLVQNSSLTE